MMKILIASGKGGTGKTTIALAISKVLSKRDGTVIVDCDVEEPDVRNFIDGELKEVQEVRIPLPMIDEASCNHCGKCSQTCRYGALAVLKDRVMVFPELCNGCGACSLVCPEDAISYKQRRMGGVNRGREGDLEVIEGILDIGQAKAVPVIEAAKTYGKRPIVVYDSPPGSSCPVLESARGSDLILLVSEPTRFGIHDLKMVANSLSILDIPIFFIINKKGIGTEDILGLADEMDIPVIGEIPFDRRLSEVYARGKDPLEELTWFRESVERIAERIYKEYGAGSK